MATAPVLFHPIPLTCTTMIKHPPCCTLLTACFYPCALQPTMSAARAPPRRPQRTTAGTFAAKSAYSSDFQLNGNGYYQQEAEDPVRPGKGRRLACISPPALRIWARAALKGWIRRPFPCSTPTSSSCPPLGLT